MRYKTLLYGTLIYALKHYVHCPWNYALITFKIYFFYNSSVTDRGNTRPFFSKCILILARVTFREIDILGSLF
jgi:hypothetical protein